ncbi:MAG TPA: aminotransferase class I/II-fold pyridoxal phosphate-dependent enzyme [Balneolaceae bacterium]|nr:aminotransferase class I/II-fold pyridoxal phosphate-dependent enzyme [Balneolaceae bacterium]
MENSCPRIYLSSPHMGGNELKYVRQAFDSNWIAPLGPNVDGFEHDLESYIGDTHAAAVVSGTAAIHLGLILCGVQAGDEVICQTFTFAASANPIKYVGAKPVFVDSEPETWNMDPELLEEAIIDRMHGDDATREKPKAIIVAHLYGMPAKMDQILQIAGRYDIPVIEDAAEALGASINGKKCGRLGHLSVLSFNGNKIITTSGGGAVLSTDERLIKQARFLATQARDEAPHYQHSQLGYNYRMSNIVAGIGRGQMEVLNDRIKTRRANHDYYFNELNGCWLGENDRESLAKSNPNEDGAFQRIYFLKEPQGFFSNRWLSTILVIPEETGGVTREDIRLALEKENIESRPLWKPMHLQPLYEDCPYYGNGISDWLFEYGLCLPSGSNLDNEERLRIVTTIKSCLIKQKPDSGGSVEGLTRIFLQESESSHS